MFTGIITEIGTIHSLQKGSPSRIRITCPESAPSIQHGESVCVSGICLSALEIDASSFTANVSDETVKRSRLMDMKPGEKVNIELALRPSDRMGGHIVQGHADGLGTITSIDRVGTGWDVGISYSDNLDRYIVEKGSISVDGISLTVSHFDNHSFHIAVIPATWEDTTLQYRKAGDSVHLEVDILAKYVEKSVAALRSADGITAETLRKYGFD